MIEHLVLFAFCSWHWRLSGLQRLPARLCPNTFEERTILAEENVSEPSLPAVAVRVGLRRSESCSTLSCARGIEKLQRLGGTVASGGFGLVGFGLPGFNVSRTFLGASETKPKLATYQQACDPTKWIGVIGSDYNQFLCGSQLSNYGDTNIAFQPHRSYDCASVVVCTLQLALATFWASKVDWQPRARGTWAYLRLLSSVRRWALACLPSGS